MKRLLLTTIAVTSLLATTGFAGPIHNAAFSGNIEAVKQHIAAGADVSVKKKNSPAVLFEASGTPLHYASTKEIVELLIAKGADVNAKDIAGRTPLDLTKRYPETADLLRKHGGKTGEELKAEGK